MQTLYCVLCGKQLQYSPGASVAGCPSCDIRQPIPVSLPEDAVKQYRHICSLLRDEKKEEAARETAQLLQTYPDEPSLHWLAVLTRFGSDFARTSPSATQKTQPDRENPSPAKPHSHPKHKNQKQPFLPRFENDEQKKNHYSTLCLQMRHASTEKQYRSIAKQFREIDSVPGAAEKANQCEREAVRLHYRLLQKTEEERLVHENLQKTVNFPDEARKKRFLRRRNKKIRTGIAALLLFCSICSAVILFFLYFLLPFASYKEAGRLLKQGDTNGARAIYEELGDFLHSAEYVRNIDSAPGALETPNDFGS